MWMNAGAACIGIAAQCLLFVSVFGVATRTGSVARALVLGILFAVPGYGLMVSLWLLFSLPWQLLNVLLFAGLAWLATRRGGPIPNGIAMLASVARTHAAAVAVAGIASGVHISAAVLKSELPYDGQLYHGPILASLIQNSSLWGWTPTNEYVFYSDLTMASGINLAAFTKTVQFDDAIQVPYLLLTFALLNWVLRERVSNSFARATLALLIVSAPVVWMQSRVMYTDLAFGSLVLAAVLFVALLPRRLRTLDVVSGALIVASVLAIKPSGLLAGGFILILMTTALAVHFRHFRSRPSTIALVGAGTALAAGAAFYVRNLASFGNPLYPIAMKLGPLSLPGELDTSAFNGTSGSDGFGPGRVWDFARTIAVGVTRGVGKRDYDPGLGGFGLVPLLILALALALVLAQLWSLLRRRGRVSFVTLRTQVLLFVCAVVIVALQLMTYDSRYVIGSYFLLCAAVLITSITITTAPATERLVGIVALVAAMFQIGSNEFTFYGGIGSIAAQRNIPATWQAPTPGNPWGRSDLIAWLPDRTDQCFDVAIQTSGGIHPFLKDGIIQTVPERAYLSVFSYSLFGPSLCNRVAPIILEDAEAGAGFEANRITSADYVLLYTQDIDRWRELIPTFDDCFALVAHVPATTERYDQPEEVFANSCRGT